MTPTGLTELNLRRESSQIHAAAADAMHNLYVVEWRVGGRVLKLERVKKS